MRCLTLLAFALAWLVSGCSKPRYWVRGLVLPPGATEVALEVSKSKDAQPAQQPGQAPVVGEVPRLGVAFDSSLGWADVVQHFDRCLSSAGYKETADTFLFGQSGRQPDYRYYTSSARKETVLLHDHQPSRNQMAQVGLGRRDGPGRYELTITRRR